MVFAMKANGRRQRMHIDKNGIYDVPVLEFVLIVRCKNCIHQPTGTVANHDLKFPDYVCPCQGEDYWHSWKPSDDWFCPCGEKKEIENE